MTHLKEEIAQFFKNWHPYFVTRGIFSKFMRIKINKNIYKIINIITKMLKDYLDPDSIINTNFFESIKEIVVCTICSGILVNPRECSLCQNSFCKKCLDEWTCLNDSCPFKCEKSEFKESSRTLKNILEKLIFKCLFCDQVEKDGNYFNHLIHLKICEKIKINCPTCDSIVFKKRLKEDKFYLKLKENYSLLIEKFKILKEENQKLKEDVNFLKELQNEVPLKTLNNQYENLGLAINSNIVSNHNNNSSMINNPSGNNSNNNNNLNIRNSYRANNYNCENAELGIVDKCEHFKGNYIPIFSCCEKSFPCYICHNKYKDHEYKISNKVVCLICKNIYSGPKCNVCNTYQIYRKK